MSALALTRPGLRRGGNRLRPEQYPARGPTYVRRRCFEVDPERRDKYQRERTRKAATLAVTRGELPALLAALLYQLLERCNDQLLEPGRENGPDCSGWWSHRYIHGLILPLVHDDTSGREDGDDDTNVDRYGVRSSGRWMAQLGVLGWVEKVHRSEVINGKHRGQTNLWRFRIPDHLRIERHRIEDDARARHATRTKGRHTPKAPQNRHQAEPRPGETTAAGSAASIESNEARRQSPCPTCNGGRFVEPNGPNGGVAPCSDCGATGIARGP